MLAEARFDEKKRNTLRRQRGAPRLDKRRDSLSLSRRD